MSFKQRQETIQTIVMVIVAVAILGFVILS